VPRSSTAATLRPERARRPVRAAPANRRSQVAPRGPSRAAVRRRRRGASIALLALVALGLVMAELPAGGHAPRTAITLRLGSRTVARVAAVARDGRRLSARSLERAVRRALPSTTVLVRGPVRVVMRIDRDQAGRRAAARPDAGVVALSAAPVSSRVAAPVVAQQLRNNCESAALEVLLASLGVRADQLELLRGMPRSGPLDPVGQPPDQVWGDPDQGYVGRADGSGPAGGFGVYPRPVAQVAARYGRRLDDLTGAAPDVLYRRLLTGRAVLAWVALGDGPYGTWRSPAGKAIRVNFSEHTVVLTGVRADGSLSVINVLAGTREVWSRQTFQARYDLLGRRALAAPLTARAVTSSPVAPPRPRT